LTGLLAVAIAVPVGVAVPLLIGGAVALGVGIGWKLKKRESTKEVECVRMSEPKEEAQ